MKHFERGPVTRVVGATAVLAGQVVVFSGNNTVIPAVTGNLKYAGVALRDGTTGQTVAVDVDGEHDLQTAGAVAAGDRVIPADGGKVAAEPGTVTAASAAAVIGVATAAIADGARGPVSLDLG